MHLFPLCKRRKKLDYIKANSEVWGQALLDFGYNAKQCTQAYATVMFRGKVSFVEDIEQKREAFQVLNDQLKSPPERPKGH